VLKRYGEFKIPITERVRLSENREILFVRHEIRRFAERFCFVGVGVREDGYTVRGNE